MVEDGVLVRIRGGALPNVSGYPIPDIAQPHLNHADVVGAGSVDDAGLVGKVVLWFNPEVVNIPEIGMEPIDPPPQQFEFGGKKFVKLTSEQLKKVVVIQP